MNNRKLIVKLSFRIVTIYKQIREYLVVYLFKIMGAKIGRDTQIGNVNMSIPEQVCIGNNCIIEDSVRLRVGGPWKQSYIDIGDNTFIGHSSQINVGSPIKIGKNCMIAPLCIFTDANHGFNNLNIPMKEQPCSYKPITIMDDVWIGSGCVILGGVTIGKGVVIAAGAVVNKSVPDYEIWGGIPARKLKSRKEII